MSRYPRQTFTIEIPQRQPLSPEASTFLSHIRQQIAGARAGKMCCCDECLERETLSSLAGYCAIRMTLDANCQTHEQMDSALHELARDLPHMCIDRAKRRDGAPDHTGN